VSNKRAESHRFGTAEAGNHLTTPTVNAEEYHGLKAVPSDCAVS